MKILIAVLVAVALLVAVPVVSYISNANYGNRAEVGVVKEYENLQNILSQYTLKVGEAAQVPKMRADDLKGILQAAFSGEGGDAVQAIFGLGQGQAVTQADEVYTKIQTLIEAGRNQFQNSQTRFLDIKATYVANLGYVWKGFWLRTAGYPKLAIGFPYGSADDFEIVKSQSAVDSFESGIDNGIKLRQ